MQLQRWRSFAVWLLAETDRDLLHEILNYIAAELHKSFSPIFSPAISGEDKAKAIANVSNKFDYINGLLSDDRSYLLGDEFTVADAYLLVMINWANHFSISMDKWSNLSAFAGRVGARENVQTALKAEGLLN